MHHARVAETRAVAKEQLPMDSRTRWMWAVARTPTRARTCARSHSNTHT